MWVTDVNLVSRSDMQIWHANLIVFLLEIQLLI